MEVSASFFGLSAWEILHSTVLLPLPRTSFPTVFTPLTSHLILQELIHRAFSWKPSQNPHWLGGGTAPTAPHQSVGIKGAATGY